MKDRLSRRGCVQTPCKCEHHSSTLLPPIELQPQTDKLPTTRIHLLPAPSAASHSLPGLSLLRLMLRSSWSLGHAAPSSCCLNVAHGSARLVVRPSIELASRLTARPQLDAPAEIESKQGAGKTDRAPDVAISDPMCTVQTLRFVQRISHQSNRLLCRPNSHVVLSYAVYRSVGSSTCRARRLPVGSVPEKASRARGQSSDKPALEAS